MHLPTCPRRETVLHGRPCSRAQARNREGSERGVAVSQRNAPPHSISCSPPKSAYGAVDLTDSRQSGRRRRVAQKRMRVIANAHPGRRSVVDAARRRAARGRCIHRGRRAGQPGPQSPAAKQVADSGIGCPPHSLTRRIASSADISNTRVASLRGSGRHLSDTSVITPSVPSAPAHQARTRRIRRRSSSRVRRTSGRRRAPSRIRMPSTRSRTAPA